MEEILQGIEGLNIPKHIAIIMDGNGRWAKQKGKIRVLGHKEGVKAVRRAIDCANKIGIKYLTLYTFSTENWKRPKFEVDALMSLFVSTLSKEINALHNDNVKFKVIGDIEQLPSKPKNEVYASIEKTKNNTGMTLVIALNYSGRQEVLQGVNNLLKSGLKQIDEKTFEKYLYTRGIPDPDLVLRTGGEYRISNFLLWQIAYSEMKIYDKFWPDFNEQDLIDAVKEFGRRERRFGKISEQLT